MAKTKEQVAKLRLPETDGPAPDAALTMTHLEDPTQEEAYRQGWWAYRWNKVFEDNPYSEDESVGDDWAYGWHEAEGNDEEEINA